MHHFRYYCNQQYAIPADRCEDHQTRPCRAGRRAIDMNEQNSTAINGFIKPNNIRLNRIVKMQLTEGLIEMVAADLGFSIMPAWMARPYLDQGKVMALPLPGKTLKRKWYAISYKKNGKAQAQFIELLRKELRKRPITSSE